MTTEQKIESMQALKRGETDTLPQPVERTAAEAYNEHKRNILSQIDNLKKLMKEADKKFNGKDWGYVGSLNYVSKILKEADDHLS